MLSSYAPIRYLGLAVAALAAATISTAQDRPSGLDAGAYGGGWSAVHADAANSDYDPRKGATDLTLAWSRKLPGMINLGPTSDTAGRLFVTTGGAGCHLHALDATTGETIWCSDVVDRLAVASSPLIDRNGNLYLGDGTRMRSFAPDGAVRWEWPIIGVPLSAQFTPAGDLLFITHVGVIYVLDRSTGKPVLKPHALVDAPSFDPGEGMTACMRGLAACPSANTPAIDLRSGRFYFTFWEPGAPSSGVRAMRITPGPRPRLVDEWTNDGLPGGSASSPDLSADGTRLYLTDNDGSLHALDAATGASLWSVPLGYQAGGSVSVSPEGLILPAGGRDAGLLAIRDRGKRGEIVWRKPHLGNFGIATQAAGFVAYPTVRTGRGTADLLVIDPRTGAELDREPIPGTPYFTVGTTLGRNAMVYVPTIGGELHAFAPAR